MLVDQRGAHVGDVRVLGDMVEHERLQLAGVGHGDQDQEVIAAGDHEQCQGLGASDDEVTEALDGGAGLGLEAHGDEGLDSESPSATVAGACR